MTRRLAYASQPGHVYPESAWISARKWLEGETETAARAAIEQLIASGKIVVVKETA